MSALGPLGPLVLNSLHTGYLLSADFSQIENQLFRNTVRVSNSLDPDQARHFVGPDLCSNCLQRLSADDTSLQGSFNHTFITLQYG